MNTKDASNQNRSSPQYSLLWGDLHRQTHLTCGEGTVRDHFEAARDQYDIDFFSVTDNAVLTEDPTKRQFAGEALLQHPHFLPALKAHSITEDDWNEFRKFAKEVEGEHPFFFLGYEWCSNRYGDRNVYHLKDGEMVLDPELPNLHRAFQDTDTLMVIHHPGYAKGRRGADWNHHDPRLERLVEIFSTQHGSSEGPEEDPNHPLYSRSMGRVSPETCVMAALTRGYKLGFTGGSDAHSLAQVPGKTGVYADEPTKEALWEALKHRRTCATTGPKFPVWVEADGHGNGSIVTTDALPTFTIVLPQEGWTSAELVRNGDVITSWDHEPTGRLQYEEVPSDRLQPNNFYYVRVHLEDGHRAWSSPIWVSYLPDVPFVRDTLYWLPEERCFLWASLEDGSLSLTFENGQVSGSTLGPYMAPDDVTIANVTIELVGGDGEILENLSFGPIAEGASKSVEMPAPKELQRVRAIYTDPFENVRRIERRYFMDVKGTYPFSDASAR